MTRQNVSVSIISAIALLLGMSFFSGCTREKLAVPPMPIIPDAYFKCTPVDALTLLDEYFFDWNSIAQIEAQYNGKIFVFKNVEITRKQIDDLKKGYIWVEMCQCAIINIEYVTYFKVGGKVDVVGINQGLSKEFRGLIFSDCFVLPAGMVELPAAGQGGTFIPFQ